MDLQQFYLNREPADTPRIHMSRARAGGDGCLQLTPPQISVRCARIGRFFVPNGDWRLFCGEMASPVGGIDRCSDRPLLPVTTPLCFFCVLFAV